MTREQFIAYWQRQFLLYGKLPSTIKMVGDDDADVPGISVVTRAEAEIRRLEKTQQLTSAD